MSKTPSAERAREVLIEQIARMLIKQRGVSPEVLYEHHEWDDLPTDERVDYTDPFTHEPRVRLMHRAWRKRVKDAAEIVDAFASQSDATPTAAAGEGVREAGPALPDYDHWLPDAWDAYLRDLVGWEDADHWARLPATFRWSDFYDRLRSAAAFATPQPESGEGLTQRQRDNIGMALQYREGSRETVPARASPPACDQCKGHGYFVMAPSITSAGGEKVPCPKCRPIGVPVALASPPANVAAVVEARRDAVIEALGYEIGDSYDCTRVWEAWSVGTMSAADFEPVDQRIEDIADTILAALDRLTAAQAEGRSPGTAGDGREAFATALSHNQALDDHLHGQGAEPQLRRIANELERANLPKPKGWWGHFKDRL